MFAVRCLRLHLKSTPISAREKPDYLTSRPRIAMKTSKIVSKHHYRRCNLTAAGLSRSGVSAIGSFQWPELLLVDQGSVIDARREKLRSCKRRNQRQRKLDISRSRLNLKSCYFIPEAVGFKFSNLISESEWGNETVSRRVYLKWNRLKFAIVWYRLKFV